MTSPNQALAESLTSRDATIGILGMGYVGLPLALAFAEGGFNVLGFDVNPGLVAALNAGESHIRHLDPARVAKTTAEGKLEATADFDRIPEADALLICVPTPLTAQREPEMRYVRATAEAIGPRLRAGHLVILESTTYPGTTDELLRGILEERSGLTAGKDFFLAYSPEREDPGNAHFETKTIPKVVGGIDKVSGDLAQQLYDAVITSTIRVSSARIAEASKLTENIFRAVNIALVNELKVVYERMGIDVWEVLDAAASKPFGFMRFNPGPGWGGHCIPLDPFYLSWKAREHGVPPKFIELAGEVNVEMPRYVVQKLQGALNDHGKAVKNSRVLILGLAYKKDIDDPRESPAFEVIEQILELGANIAYHDPHIAKAPKMRTWPHLPPMESVPLNPETIASYDAVVLVTAHTAVDYDIVLEHAQLVVDTRGVYPANTPKVIKA